jgi:hypothetical protein
MPVCYFEILYELILILKAICGLDSRTKFFFETYNEYIQPFLDNILDLGLLNYLLKVVRDLYLVSFMYLELNLDIMRKYICLQYYSILFLKYL